MTWHVRFRRRLRVLPGVWLNLARRGISASAGIRGLTFNSRGRTTASLPGTGLSVTSTASSRREDPGHNRRTGARTGLVVALIVVFLACLAISLLTR